MSFAGIDFSTNAIDVVRLNEDDDQAIWDRIRLAEPPQVDAFGRARRVRDLMPARGAWADHGVVMFAIEKPMTRSFTSCATLMRIQGAVLACLPADIPVLELPPVEWKRETVGKAMADKSEVWRWSWDQLDGAGAPAFVPGAGAVPWPQDAMDAYAIARAARAICDRAAQAAA